MYAQVEFQVHQITSRGHFTSLVIFSPIQRYWRRKKLISTCHPTKQTSVLAVFGGKKDVLFFQSHLYLIINANIINIVILLSFLQDRRRVDVVDRKNRRRDLHRVKSLPFSSTLSSYQSSPITFHSISPTFRC